MFVFRVLNLVISGIPSILKVGNKKMVFGLNSFKPCYKWNTFNTMKVNSDVITMFKF